MSADTKSSDIEAVTQRPDLPAGEFSSWLRRTRNAQTERGSAEVACGVSTAGGRLIGAIDVGCDLHQIDDHVGDARRRFGTEGGDSQLCVRLVAPQRKAQHVVVGPLYAAPKKTRFGLSACTAMGTA